ncbi:MAG TPA: MCE family protein [Acidimicrobiales bacterium]|nr:MCE family protein [Acidimicrobiales bacterium]
MRVPRVRRLGGSALVVALLAACSIQTATAPTGSLTLYATFEDAQDLTPGHNVQISNVVTGSVRDVSLDGYQARVRLSIKDGQRIPEGTVAVIRRTSLLGEYFVDLVLPARFDTVRGPFLESGATITDTSTQADLEQLAQQASIVVGALTADDLATSVQAGAEALGGRGATLHKAIQDAGAVIGALADQSAAIGTAVDGLAALGAALGPVSDRVGTVVEQLAEASAEVAGGRAEAVEAVDALVALAAATNEHVLAPHTERLRVLLSQVNPILGSLAERTDVLADLVTNLLRFTEAFPTALHDGQVLLLAWAYLPTALEGSISATDPEPLAALAQLARSTR